MATGNKAAWQAIQSKLMALGYGQNVVICEPRSKMQSGTIAIIPIDGHVDEVTLTGPREIHSVQLRMYRNWLEEAQDETEFELDEFRATIQSDILGDFDLGGNVAYALPAEFVWTYEQSTVEATLYRVINLHIAYRVDDNANFG